MAHYWNKYFICPYFHHDEMLKISCEDGCKVTFKSKEEAKEFIDKYCATFDYKQCTIAQKFEKFYEEKYGK